MNRDDPSRWMWSEAIAMLTQAERMRRDLFPPRTARQPAWEPPVDVLELEGEVLILVALPGIDPDSVEASIEGGALRVAGRRPLPAQLRTAIIHRLELPQGRFERVIPLPPGHYDAIHRSAANGCLIFSLRKI